MAALPHRRPTDIDRQRGREIAALRASAHRTQVQVGEHLGVSHQQIGKYERGQSSMTLGVYEEIRSYLLQFLAPGLAEDQAAYRTSARNAALVRDLRRIKADVDTIKAKIEKAIRDAEHV